MTQPGAYVIPKLSDVSTSTEQMQNCFRIFALNFIRQTQNLILKFLTAMYCLQKVNITVIFIITSYFFKSVTCNCNYYKLLFSIITATELLLQINLPTTILVHVKGT